MDAKPLKALLVIALALTALDWLLGSMIVRDIIPDWVMVMANIPFGYVYLWTEAHWMGSQYQVDGHLLQESTVNAAQLAALVAQVLVYFGLWLLWERRRGRKAMAA